VVAINTLSVNGISQIDAVFEGAAFDTAEVMEALKTTLPAYMMPSRVHFIAVFPLNANGKIDRKELRKIITATA
jgi:D-alanine--poly(phosphoribitol) ligase subunit 1